MSTFGEITLVALLSIVLALLVLLWRQRVTARKAADLLQWLDIETRQEVGAWLHTTVQPKLLALARSVRMSGDLSRDQIAAQLDELNERVVRNYSHQLYPSEIELSLEVALSSLLRGRAELILGDYFRNVLASAPVDLSWLPRSTGPAVAPQVAEMIAEKFLAVDLKYAIYRIIEEGVANAEKKPSTKKIRVTLEHSPKWVTVCVSDDGDPLAGVITKGLGSQMISALVTKFGGTSSLSNIATGGVLLSVKLRTKHAQSFVSGLAVSKATDV